VIPGKHYIAWNLPNPKPMSLEQVRPLRDEIATRVRDLIAELDGQQPAPSSEGSPAT
jgi:hypothetical protein